MKKLLAILLCALLFSACSCCLPALADDLADECKIYHAEKGRLDYLTDHDDATGVLLREADEHVLEIRPGATPVASLSLVMGHDILPFTVQTQDADGCWKVIAEVTDTDYAQRYVSFPAQSKLFRLVFAGEEPAALSLREVYLFAENQVDPELAHDWQTSCDKADIMTIVAHPDDELLWFGGTIPYYAGQQGLKVQAVYMTCSDYQRRIELLNGLWHCGVRNYPEIAWKTDRKDSDMDATYYIWGRDKTCAYLVSLLRRYRPEVVVTHDVNGEYGHSQHLATSDAVYQAVLKASDPDYDPESAERYGIWQVKKLYRHMGKDAGTIMDYDQPLSAFDGKSAYTVAKEAFDMHITQHETGHWRVPGAGDPYDSTRYTLAFSTVGDDVLGNDMLENIPPETLSNYSVEGDDGQ